MPLVEMTVQKMSLDGMTEYKKASFDEMIQVKMTPEKLPLGEMTVGTKSLE